MYLAKDFIETSEGLIFAVVENGTEHQRVLGFLRYVLTKGRWVKVNTEQANQLLTERYPDYHYYSKAKDVALHAVATTQITIHHQPRLKLQQLIKQPAVDDVQQDFQQLIALYQQQGIDTRLLGVTGSMLINAQNSESDIDLVVYDRQTFHEIRSITKRLLTENCLQALSVDDWQASCLKRDCTISIDDYIWHEQRKLNKALINGRKFDLGLLISDVSPVIVCQKKGRVVLTAMIVDDQLGFDYPAILQIDHPEISEIVCYTATYVGQAFIGETVEVAGLLEQSEQGQQRVVVGTTREAVGEYIKVLNV